MKSLNRMNYKELRQELITTLKKLKNAELVIAEFKKSSKSKSFKDGIIAGKEMSKKNLIELLNKQAKELEDIHNQEIKNKRIRWIEFGVVIGMFTSAIAYFLGGLLRHLF